MNAFLTIALIAIGLGVALSLAKCVGLDIP